MSTVYEVTVKFRLTARGGKAEVLSVLPQSLFDFMKASEANGPQQLDIVEVA